MRRHLRNHTRPAFSRSQSATEDRRRKRQVPALVRIDVREQISSLLSPSISSLNAGDDSGEGDDCDLGDGIGSEELSQFDGEDEDELLEEYDLEGRNVDDEHITRYHTSSEYSSLPSSPGPWHQKLPYSQSRSRVLPPGLQSSSPSPSSGSSPPHVRSGYRYTPSSAEYVRSCTDTRVSTALHPAFYNRMQVDAVMEIKQEPVC